MPSDFVSLILVGIAIYILLVLLFLSIYSVLKKTFPELIPLEAGDRFKVELDSDGKMVAYELKVTKNGTVRLPRGGSCNVLGLKIDKARGRIRDHDRAQAALRREVAVKKQPAPQLPCLPEGLQLQPLVLRESWDCHLEEWDTQGVPRDYKKLHDHYRVGALEFVRIGNVIRVIVQGLPSGAVRFDWATLRSNPMPYDVVVRQDGMEILSERAYRGRFTRFLEPGVDYRFAFEVYQWIGAFGEEWRNVERDFSFVITVPTDEQWNWNPSDEQSATQLAIKQMEKAVEDRHAIERAIDNLHLDADESQRLKAAQIARQIQRMEE